MLNHTAADSQNTKDQNQCPGSAGLRLLLPDRVPRHDDCESGLAYGVYYPAPTEAGTGRAEQTRTCAARPGAHPASCLGALTFCRVC